MQPSPMTADEQRRLSRVETRIEDIDEDLKEIKSDVKSVLASINQVKGGGKMAIWTAGIVGGSGGAAIVKWLLPFVGK